jgi:hypothetical protein
MAAGKWDCYQRAGPDEQMIRGSTGPDATIFMLIDRDPLAPFLVSIWSKLRMGDPIAARVVFDTMCAKVAGRYIAAPDVDKASEAMDCALAMFRAQEEQG